MSLCTELPDGGHNNLITGRYEEIRYTSLSKIW